MWTEGNLRAPTAIIGQNRDHRSLIRPNAFSGRRSTGTPRKRKAHTINALSLLWRQHLTPVTDPVNAPHLAHRKGRQPVTPAGGAGCGARGQEVRRLGSRAALGIMSAGTMTGTRGAPLEVEKALRAKPAPIGAASTKPGPELRPWDA
jgi:hypothetical protein